MAPVALELTALDHDMCKCSITPSVILRVHQEQPSVEKSFVCGKVTTCLNDSAFQTSSPFRHAAMMVKMFENDPLPVPNILLKYSDGGTDQRNTLESVRCATICLFKELNFDMVIAARCAPGQSYMNPAERVMSILNIGLQTCATERRAMDEKTESLLKRCSSVANVRSLAEKNHEIKQKWLESVEPVQAVIRSRFRRLNLKEEPITVIDPVTDQDIGILKRHLRGLFPTLDLNKLQKLHTRKNQAYMTWKSNHCHETNYTFQVRKCQDLSCCSPTEVDADALT